MKLDQFAPEDWIALGFVEAPALGRMESMAESEKHPGQQRYPQEVKDRGVRMVPEVADREGAMSGLIHRVVRQLGVGCRV